MNETIYSLIAEMKSELIHFYDANKFEIDIKGQELLSDLIKNNNYSDKQKNKILEYNKKFIKIVEDIFEENMKKMNEESTKTLIESEIMNDRETIRSMITNKCCYFIRSDYLLENISLDNPLGLIIITDWFIDENQINYLKFFKEKLSKNLTFFYDENVVNLSFGLKECTCSHKMKSRIQLAKTEIIRKLAKLQSCEFFNIYTENESCTSVKKNTFKNMKRIKELKMLDNLVETDTFYYLRHLKRLFLTGKPIRLNEEIVSINDEYNVVAPQVNLLDSIKSLTNLEALKLVKSTIQIVDENSFGSHEKLKHLDLSYNVSNSLPIETFKNKFNNLVSLSLNKCQLNQIQDNLFISLINLNSLNLSNNNITILNENSFNGLEKLKDLYLFNSGIKEIKPNSFASLKSLTRLEMINNSLEIIYENEFFGLFNLVDLVLFKNSIKQFKQGAFRSLNKLKNLDIRGNQIKEINENSMQGLNNLQFLNFADNSILKIDINAFYGLNKLKKIDLSENPIGSFDFYEFKSKYGLTSLSEFVIDGVLESQDESEDEDQPVFEILYSDFDSDSSDEGNHVFYRIILG